MDSESQIALLLAQVDTGTRELEQTVENFEQAVIQAERCLNDAENSKSYTTARIAPLTHALQTGYEAADLVHAAQAALDDVLIQAEIAAPVDPSPRAATPLPPGTVICDGRYRLVRLLHSRPRVHLYLAHRLAMQNDKDRSLVAIREIVLTGLGPTVRQSVVRAAFEEFAAPQLFGSAHLAGVGDHLYLEDDRHYLVMRPRQVRGNTPARAQPLAERLPGPTRPDIPTALYLGTRLCQTVTRLHRLRLYLGELTPAMLLIDRAGNAAWAPLLLAAWPPAPSFWPEQRLSTAQTASEHIFPVLPANLTPAAQDEHAFVAPEVLTGPPAARADVYTLGAILYLLFTGSIPPAASQRLRAHQDTQHNRVPRPKRRHAHLLQDATLPSPHLLNEQISPLLEQILLRALALQPEQRFASMRDLTEALESISFKNDLPATPTLAPPFPRAKASRLHRLLQWLRR